MYSKHRDCCFLFRFGVRYQWCIFVNSASISDLTPWVNLGDIRWWWWWWWEYLDVLYVLGNHWCIIYCFDSPGNVEALNSSMCYVDIHGNTRHGPDISVIVCTDHWQAGDSEVFLSLSLLSGFIFFIFWRWSCWITEGFRSRDGLVLHQYGNLQVKIRINYWSQSLLHVSQTINTNSLGIFKLIENCDLI